MAAGLEEVDSVPADEGDQTVFSGETSRHIPDRMYFSGVGAIPASPRRTSRPPPPEAGDREVYLVKNVPHCGSWSDTLALSPGLNLRGVMAVVVHAHIMNDLVRSAPRAQPVLRDGGNCLTEAHEGVGQLLLHR